MSLKQRLKLPLFSWRTPALLIMAAILGFVAGIWGYNLNNYDTFESGVKAGIEMGKDVACKATCEDIGTVLDTGDPLYPDARADSVCFCRL